MKRTWISLLLCLTFLLQLLPEASASGEKIVDRAGLLTPEEALVLEEKAQALADAYRIDVVIVTVWSLDGKSSEAYADDFFDGNGYGYGQDNSGVLLLLSMEYRDWAISTCGDGIYALTDYGIESVFSQIAGSLSEDAYFEAFNTYLDALEPYFRAYAEGDPIDGNIYDYQGPGTYQPGTQEEIVYYEKQVTVGLILTRLLIALLIGAAVSGGILMGMRSQMNTAKAQYGAGCYLKDGTYHLQKHQDIFLYSHVSRTRRAEQNSGGSHGGGSSVHTSSGGSHHGGGHGKF